jgi:hypothetical protein
VYPDSPLIGSSEIKFISTNKDIHLEPIKVWFACPASTIVPFPLYRISICFLMRLRTSVLLKTSLLNVWQADDCRSKSLLIDGKSFSHSDIDTFTLSVSFKVLVWSL